MDFTALRDAMIFWFKEREMLAHLQLQGQTWAEISDPQYGIRRRWERMDDYWVLKEIREA